MPNRPRSSPTHWIWTVDAPHRFEPDGEVLDLIEPFISVEQRWEIDQMLDEGATPEQIVAFFQIDGQFPPGVVELIGSAMAFWAAQKRVEDALRRERR